MPFKLQRSSTLVIQPCYDGRVLPITHQVAADGLALLSIKDSHRECTVERDPTTKASSLSCTRGIKPRNSFWNLHKPELRKIRGIDCNTTDNVIHLFQSHAIESGSVMSVGRRIMGKLGSMMYKKTRPARQPQILVQNVSWPINCCVLSSICQETEIVSPGIPEKGETEKTLNKFDFHENSSVAMNKEGPKDAVFITPPSDMHENTSDDLIPISELQDPSKGDSSTNTSRMLRNTGLSISHECQGREAAQSVLSSSILLENKQSQHQISIPSNVELYSEKPQKENSLEVINTLITDSENQCIIKEGAGNAFCEDCRKAVIDDPSSIAVQSVFSDILKDIEEIKDVINSYMSSFYTQEEEHNNFPTLYTPSQEIAAHFIDQILVSTIGGNCDPRNLLDTFPDNFKEHEQDCFTGQCKIKVDGSKDEQNLNKHETGKETQSYCYWEDNDIVNEFSSQLLGNEPKSYLPENDNNNALLSREFIENMWQEFTNQVETHALFVDLVNENESRKSEQRRFPSYGHWSNMYDPNIFHEAENIVHTLDSLLMNGCFQADEGHNPSYIPCTIIEVVDEREFANEVQGQLEENKDKPNNKDGGTSIKHDPLEIPIDSYSMIGEISIANDSVDETINTEKVHNVKLEPTFYQEKVSLNEIIYSREPEYERVQLDPVSLEGRVDFSTLQAGSFNNVSTEEMKKFETEERVKYYVPANDNVIPKYDEYIIEDSSKNQQTLEMDEAESCKNENNTDSETRKSVFEIIQENNSHENPNSAFLFSSPAVQFNLTSTLNTNKK